MFSQPAIFKSKSTNPFVNLALGQTLTKLYRQSGSKSHLMFLSRSDHAVMIGRHQNCWAECNLNKMSRDKIPLVRRQTGGGACYVDQGNALFAFISPNSAGAPQANYDIVKDGLHSLGFDATLKGRNDLVIDDKKVSGSAFQADPDFFKHHGTILHSVDKDALGQYLNPNKLKLQSHGIKSIHNRIVNLVDIQPELQFESVNQALIKSFRKRYAGAETHILDFEFARSYMIDELYGKEWCSYWQEKADLTDPSFIYNKEMSDYSFQLEHKFPFGLWTIQVQCRAEKIVDCRVYTDSLDTTIASLVQQEMISERYDPPGLSHVHNKVLQKLAMSYLTSYHSAKFDSQSLELQVLFDWLIQESLT
jgi:lipoate-protein ligase A